jgi:hypothetical protein
MPSYLSAAIDINNWRSINWALECFSATPGGIDRKVFQKQNSVRGFVCDNFLMQITLHIPRSLILNGIATKSNPINYKLHGSSLGHRNTRQIGHWGKPSGLLIVN